MLVVSCFSVGTERSPSSCGWVWAGRPYRCINAGSRGLWRCSRTSRSCPSERRCQTPTRSPWRAESWSLKRKWFVRHVSFDTVLNVEINDVDFFKDVRQQQHCQIILQLANSSYSHVKLWHKFASASESTDRLHWNEFVSFQNFNKNNKSSHV